jgi:dihydrofolate synthase / folylpolyglutamate synthase
MGFEKTERFLESLSFKLKGFDLKTMQKLIEKTGLETEKLKVIHVAGTNGKGSVTKFASEILKAQGLKVGSYYSPHISNIRERIQINGKRISKKDFVLHAESFKKMSDGMKEKPSYFEMLTAMAIKHFIQEKVDVAVVEVGLGGRLDATNLLKGNVCVITEIGIEHADFLGNTIEKIAREKAGIIKKESVIVVGEKNRGRKMIEEIAGKKNCRIVIPKYRLVESNAEGNCFDLQKPAEIRVLKTKALGSFQAENAVLAATATLEFDKLEFNKLGFKELDFGTKEKAIRTGLKKAGWKGRFQKAGENPLVLLDSAHNPPATKALVKNLGLFEFEKIVLVFAVLKDKDVKKILKELKWDSLIITKVNSNRALEPERIKAIAGEGEIIEEPKKAFEKAFLNAGKKDAILVCGSNYLLGEALKYFKNKKN